MSADSPLRADESGVFLKYLLLEGLNSGEIRYWRMRWRTDTVILLRQRLEELLSDMLSALSTFGGLLGIEFDILGRSLLASPLYPHRLIDLALEAVLSEPLAPELCIKLTPSSPHALSAALPGAWNHAVIFASPVFFTHEFYPLAVDACVHDYGHAGSLRTNVLGAHMDWLTKNGQLKRIIYLDFSTGRLIETNLTVPVQPDSVQFLCLGSQEQARHAVLSQRYNCVQVNPASASRLADDKAATLATWSALGLEVPAYQAIAPEDLATALCFLDSFAEIVVKPNQATEGEHVAFFQRNDPQAKTALKKHLERCWEQGTAIAQQRRDGVFFRIPASETNHTLALRLNLAFDGERHCLESGYAQLGQDEHHPAACGRGGHIVPIDEALSSLTYRGKPIRLASSDWIRIRTQAEQAAGLFEKLMLIGLDVLLEYDQFGNITPVFLESNPRPAGLSHSRLLADDPFMPAQIGVSLKLWACMNQVHPATLTPLLP